MIDTNTSTDISSSKPISACVLDAGTVYQAARRYEALLHEIRTSTFSAHSGIDMEQEVAEEETQLQQARFRELRTQNRGMREEVASYKEMLASTKNELLQLQQEVKELVQLCDENSVTVAEEVAWQREQILLLQTAQ